LCDAPTNMMNRVAGEVALPWRPHHRAYGFPYTAVHKDAS
jgi:hypothetical protein